MTPTRKKGLCKPSPFSRIQMGLEETLFQLRYLVLGDDVAHLAVKIRGVERFDEKAIGTGFETGCHLIELGVHADHQDRCVLALGQGSQMFQHVQTIDLGHVDVKQDQVGL